MKNYKYKSFPRFNDHGASCKGHGNFFLDDDLSGEEDRELVIKVLDNLIIENEKKLAQA